MPDTLRLVEVAQQTWERSSESTRMGARKSILGGPRRCSDPCTDITFQSNDRGIGGQLFGRAPGDSKRYISWIVSFSSMPRVSNSSRIGS